jgi:hypothetical protein
MASDPIREALRAAERAIARSMHAAGMPAALGEDQWHEEAAAAVAAFLRALPVQGDWGVSGWEGSVTSSRQNSGIWNAEELAAVVERQAREGRG